MGPKKNKIKKESEKKSKEPKIAQRWTDADLDAYTDVLADLENSFAAALDKLALKSSSNNEVFEHIQKELAAEMEAEDFYLFHKQTFFFFFFFFLLDFF